MQRVVRTYVFNVSTDKEMIGELQGYLQKGWKVIFITKVKENIIEYIIELKDTLEED